MNTPEKIDRYEVKSSLGKGGMANVLLAHDPAFQRDVAVKLISDGLMENEKSRIRFEREARTIAKLEHHAIVPVYDFGTVDGRAYLVMRAMSGGTLEDRMHAGSLSIQEIGDILERICSALEKAHANGVIHRDLKPANIFFDDENLAYLGDFGIAYLEAGTKTGSIIGTANYMAPEQARGQDLDARTDVYQMGVILFEMLAGQPPYKGDNTAAVLFQHVAEPIPNIQRFNANVPPEFQALVELAMAKDPGDRPQSAAELLTQFKQVARGSRPIKPFTQSKPFNETILDSTEVQLAPFDPPAPAVQTSIPGTQPQFPPPEPPGRNRNVLIGGLVLLLILMSGVIGAFLFITLFGAEDPTPVPVVTQLTDAEGAEPAEPIVITQVVTSESEPEPAVVDEEPTETPVPTETAVPTETPTPTVTPTSAPVFSDFIGGGSGQVAFAADPSGSFEIFVGTIGENGGTQLTNNQFDDFGPVFSPDGSQIAFHGFTGNDWEVYVMNADGSSLRNLTQNSNADDAFPVWSPDGSQIAFHSNRDVDFEIYVTDLNGARLTQLTFNTVDDFGPSYSPDGSEIVFHRRIDGLRQLFIMNVDGSGARQLTFDTDGESLYGEWSPNGSQIVYMFQPENTTDDIRDIYLINSTGGARIPLHSDRAGRFYPKWSPDGAWILYHQEVGSGSRELFIIRPDGTELQQMTTSASRDERMPDLQP